MIVPPTKQARATHSPAQPENTNMQLVIQCIYMALLYQITPYHVSTHGWSQLPPFIAMEIRRVVVAIEEPVIGATHSPKPQQEGLPTAPPKHTPPIVRPKPSFEPFFSMVRIHTLSPHDREQYGYTTQVFPCVTRISCWWRYKISKKCTQLYKMVMK